MNMVASSSATITDSTFAHNSADDFVSSSRSRLPIDVASHVRAFLSLAPRPQGGAIRVVFGSSATITDTTFAHNSANRVSPSRSRLSIGVVSHVRAFLPLAPRPQGGAIYIDTYSSATITDSTFAHNSARNVSSSCSRLPIGVASHVRAFSFSRLVLRAAR